MKNLNKIHTLLLFSVFALFMAESVRGQSQWIPKSISIQIPMMVRYHFYSSGYPFPTFDSSFNQMKIDTLTLGNFNHPSDYSTQGNLVTISYFDQQQGANFQSFKSTQVRFTFDLIDSVFHNISIANSFRLTPNGTNGHYESAESFVKILSLKFNIKGDTLIASTRGEEFHTNIDSIYFGSDTSEVVQGNSVSSEDVQIDSLLKDTALYQCSLVFIRTNPASIEHDFSKTTESFTIATSLSDHTIHFSFPACDHAQRMTIYDILGREVSRIEIPAGSSSYAMSSISYPKGAFFVRLGLQTANFVIN